MSKFNLMPILRTGKFTDKNGQLVEIDHEKLDKIISATNVANEPQFVVEHPKADFIGFGTIEQLKRVGDILFALPKTVEDKFKQAVNSGKLPGRSVTLDKKTFALKNISFLPPEISPAVSGLGLYNFSAAGCAAIDEDTFSLRQLFAEESSHFADVEGEAIEFQKYEVSSYPFRSIQTLFRNIKSLITEKYGRKDAEDILPEYSLNDIGNPPAIFETSPRPSPWKGEGGNVGGEGVNPSFSQNQNGDTMDKVALSTYDFSKVDANLAKAVQALLGENKTLADNLGAKEIELQAATSKLSAAETAKLRTEILQFCESDDVKLKIKPADKEKVVNYLMAQKEKGVIEFSAPDNKETKMQFSAFDFAKEQIKNLPDVIQLSELATNVNAGEQVPDYQKVAKQMADSVNKNR